jgi:molybdopterin-containing oxidoreductase family membrane subunit
VVSFDFAIGIIPGWHTTILPPYFVAGAIYSGFAMVLTLMIPLRAAYGLKDFITDRHLNNMAKVMLATGLIVAYGYAMELFFAWYSGNAFEWAMMRNRLFGDAWKSYWLLILCNIAIPQLLWIPKIRVNPMVLFVISIVVNIGMWLERYVIVVTSLERDFIPANWANYYPTVWDISLYIGTIGFFFFMMFLFIRVLSMISIFEMRTMVPARDPAKSTPRAGAATAEGGAHA